MTQINTKPRRLLLFTASLTLILTGCVQVDIVDRSDVTSEEPPPGRPMSHNLTATGIVFEPPLDEIGRSALRQGVDLFIEVENSGLYDETDVIVQVTLETESQREPLAQQEAVINKIAPNETEQAHFRLTELVDLYSHYMLHVAVAPCAGETFIKDNQRAFDLYVTPVP
jgi:hypothetical protein